MKVERQSHLLTLLQNPYFCMTESVGHYYNYPDHSVYRKSGALNNFNIHFVVSGKGYIEIDDQIYQLGAGDAVLYFPLQKQKYYSSEDDPWNIRWFHFYGSTLHDYFIACELHSSPLWSIRQPELWIEAHEELLAEAIEQRMLHPGKLSTLTYALITAFIEHAVPLSDHRAKNSEQRIFELLPLMQQEAAEPFTLERWSDAIGVSPHYFCKLFKHVMEMTPMEFITRCRLQLAKQWLLDRKHVSIGVIANDAGYPSVSYFNKRFLEYEGMTPSAYRSLFES